MNKHDIIRAWKDPGFRARLTPEQLADLPESPAGRPMTALEDTDLAGAVGGKAARLLTSEGACPSNACDVSVAFGSCDCF